MGNGTVNYHRCLDHRETVLLPAGVAGTWRFGVPFRSGPYAMTKSALLAALLISIGKSAAIRGSYRVTRSEEA